MLIVIFVSMFFKLLLLFLLNSLVTQAGFYFEFYFFHVFNMFFFTLKIANSSYLYIYSLHFIFIMYFPSVCFQYLFFSFIVSCRKQISDIQCFNIRIWKLWLSKHLYTYYDWLLSLSIIFSCCNMFWIFIPFCGWVKFHSICILYILCL